MALSEAELEAFVGGVREQDRGIDSPRAVQLRVVEPLLEVLGWDVRSSDVEPDVALGGARMDYVLVVGERPVVAVRTTAPGGALEAAERSLAGALRETALDWGLCTDGREYVLLALGDGELHRRRVHLDDLAENADAFEPYARDVRATAMATASTERRAAYRELAEHRDAAVTAVTEALVGVAGDPIEDDARQSAQRIVAYLLEHGPVAGSSRDASTASDGADASPDDRDRPTATDSTSDADAPADVEASPAPAPAPSSDRPTVPDDSEFVARFFGGSSSVGAVGTGHPGSTLAGVVTYLYENHDLGSAVTLPWGVDDGTALLAAAPEHPSGRSMEPHETVDGGCYVWTGAPIERTRAAIEELGDLVGLRVMFQGDW